MAQGTNWLHLNPPPSGEVSSQGGGGGVSGEADTVYVLNGPAGVAESPLPQEFKDALVPPAEPGTISVNSEAEEEVFFVGKEIVDGIIASEAAGELTPEIAAIAEPLDEESSSSASSYGGDGVNSVTASSIFNCATHEKTYNKPVNLSDLNLKWTPDPIDLGGGFTGNIKLEGDLKGQANLELKFNVKRKKVGFNCVPWSASFKTAHITGNAISETGITLTGSVNYKKDFGPWNIAKPHLFTVTFSVGWVPVSIGFNLPVTAGLGLDSTVTGTVNYNGTHTATGTFDYTCTLKDCTGTSNFTNVGENGATQTITGGVDGRVKVTPWVDVGLRAYLYTEWVAYAQVGVRPHFPGDLWGYTGNFCGDAAADGHFETARALTFDLDTRIDWTGEARVFGRDPWKKTLKTGSVNHFRFWDIYDNSTAMEPHFHGPAVLYTGDPGAYKLRMRPCWPYTDNVTYQVNWGDGATPETLTGAPGTELTVNHTWSDAGNKAASVTAVTDAHGRNINKSTPRTIEVKAITPLSVTVTPVPASSTYGVAINLTATATGGHGPTIQYTLGRRRVGTNTWLPTPLVWQASNSLAWTPAPEDVGSWELAVGVKDKTTAPDANGYGHAASALAGTVQVVAPLVLTCPAMTQTTVTSGTTVTWNISSTGGTPGTIQYAMFRQLTGNASNPWLPNPPVWQTNTDFSWTPNASDLGTWQVHIIAKDVNTPADPGFSSNCNMGQIVVVSPLTVSVTPSPATSIHGNPITWTATAQGGTPASTQFAFFRRKVGAATWTPDATQPAWGGNTYTWTPGANDVGTWEMIVWVKDGNTPANANTYGYAAYTHAGNVQVVTPPLTLSASASPAQVAHDNPVTITATAGGGTPSTTRFAFFRRKAGTVAWTPDASAAVWQAGNTFTWTPTSADLGTWETYVWVKDGDTPSTMNTYGYAVGSHAGNVTVTRPPLTVTGTMSPSASYSGVTLNWTVTPTGGDAATRQYALFRLRNGTSTWIPDVNAPAWQSNSTLSWTPTAADVGTWQIVVWAKDGDTTPTQNGYGYATYYYAQAVQIVAPLTLSVTPTPASRPHNDTRLVTWTATASGGTSAGVQYAFFRRLAGSTAWTPSVTSPAWQASNTYSWDPGPTDVGTWEIYVWAKDSATRDTMNSYGYAAGANPGTITVSAPLCLSSTASPASVETGTAITWTATTCGGYAPTTELALFRRPVGSTTWIPDVSTPAWQAGKTFTWTPTAADVGTWEILLWVRDDDTPPSPGYAANYNPGNVVVRAPLTLTAASLSPAQVVHGNPVTITATASGGVPASTQYAFFRRKTGTVAWTPDVSTPAWQSSSTFVWTPTSADLGTWETYVWVKDGYTPANQNTYGYANGRHAGNVTVTRPPLTVTGTLSPSVSYSGVTLNWTITASGGDPATRQYALFRLRNGTSNWIPDVNAPAWQSGSTLSWTPTAADLGTWQIIIWAKDGDTTPTQNGYGYATYHNAQPVQVVAPPTLTAASLSPAQVVHGNPVTITATASDGVPASTQYAFFRRKTGTVAWTPDVSTPAWQSSSTFVWTPTAADLGTWETYVWVKDGYTPANQNTYGYANGRHAGNVTVTRTPLTVTGTSSPSASYHGVTLNWTVTPSGGDPATRQYALFRLRDGASAWIPDVNAPAWQSSPTLSWTPAAGDVGNWQIVIWAKDGDTTPTQNGFGYATSYNAGPVQVVNHATLSVTMSPSSVNAGTTITWTASSTSSNPSSVQYAFFRKRSGTATWSPDVNAPAWQTSNVYSWTPTSADVGSWDTYVWVKDAYTPPTMYTYGYAAGFNTGGVQVVAPFTNLTCSGNPSTAYTGTTFNWSANASGGDSSTRRYALLRRKVGTSTWVPSQSSPSWQTSSSFSWTPSSSDAGSWEIAIWVKDANTASNANTYGYALSCSPGTIQVLTPPSVSGTSSPSQSPYGATISWTATGSGGDSGSYRYAIFRRRAGTSSWTPDVSSPNWQTSRTFSWTPTSADVGTWEVFIWIKDAYTPSNMNTYGHAAWYNAGNVEVTTPAPVDVSGTGSPSTSPAGTTLSWTATATGGIPGTYRYALFRRKAGTSNWIPDVSTPAWQTSRTMSWTPGANDVGTWEIIIWVKDTNTTPSQNGYGYADYYNAGPVQVY